MPRGKRDVSKTRRILKKVLEGRLFKQIAFEEGTTERRVSYIKNHYTSTSVDIWLNSKGQRLMAEEQLTLPLERPLHTLGLGRRTSRKTHQ